MPLGAFGYLVLVFISSFGWGIVLSGFFSFYEKFISCYKTLCQSHEEKSKNDS